MVIEMREYCVLLFCDDKVKVSIGEFGSLVLIGVRGKKIIVLLSFILVFLDYDMIKVFLIFLVILYCKIFGSIDDLFVCG